MPPRRQWIDKNSATKYQLFHRSQNDPLIHDSEADDRVLHQISGPTPQSSTDAKKSKTLQDLAKEFRGAGSRQNEGEAANYGIFYDDTEYDYMQHLRELGSGGGDAQFVEAAPTKNKGKGKATKLEDALREQPSGGLDDGDADLAVPEHGSVYGDDMGSTASSYVRKKTYQDQQEIPDAIAGFKPDMDPRLREALEALEDEAFVDEKEEGGIFGELVDGGPDAEIDPDEWRDTYIEEDDDGWESDATEKAPVQHDTISSTHPTETIEASQTESAGPTELPSQDEKIPDMNPADADWMRNFAKYKKDMKAKQAQSGARDNSSDVRTGASTLFTAGGTPVRKKKRKGALTNPSSYSMTSSSLARTDGHRLLDARFDQIEALYSLDEEGEDFDDSSLVDDMSVASGASRSSRVSQTPSQVSQADSGALPSNFDDVMDDFLGGWQDGGSSAKRKGAKAKLGKNGNEAAGMKMLDEVRQGLGPAKFRGRV